MMKSEAVDSEALAGRLLDGTYTKQGKLDLMQKICDRVANKETLAEICRDKGHPAHTTIYKWMAQDVDLAKMYNEARTTRAFSRGDKIDAITELVLKGVLDANSARVVIDAEKWLMTREAPKAFGDRVAVEHDVSGALAGAMQAARLRASTVVTGYLPVTNESIEDIDGNSE